MRLDELALRAARRPDGRWRVEKNSTYKRSYVVAEKKLLKHFGPNALVEDLTPAGIANWCAFMEKQARRGHYAIRTVNTYLSTARAMLNATGFSLLADAVELLPQPPPRDRSMKQKTFRQLVRHANVRDAAILWLLWESGRRRATICQLRTGPEYMQIYQGPDGRFRFVAKGIVEKGRQPVLCFAGHPAALAVLLWMALRPDPHSPWLFTHLDSGDPLSPDTITNIFHKLRQKAKVPADENAFAHACRHAFAQRKLNEYDQRLVADWMGIRVHTLLEVYATRDEATLEALFFGDSDLP